MQPQSTKSGFNLLLSGLIWTMLSSVAVAQACVPEVVNIRHDGAKARFTIEIADDPAEQARGLMNRESMARFAGMLFVYDRPTRATFWMKNTLIPLDMLFVDEAGVVVKIHPMATPLSETVIDGGQGVKAVLEINGGLAQALGLGEGAELQHPTFSDVGAAWPCLE